MQTWNKSFIIFLLLVVAGLIYLLAPILTPFLTGALLAYLVNPLVIKLMKYHLPRLVSVIIVFVALFLLIIFLIILLIPLIQDQFATLAVTLPSIIAWLQNKALPTLLNYVNAQNLVNITTLKTSLLSQWTKAGTLATTFLNTILQSGFILAQWLINLVLIPVVTFYLLRDWKTFIQGIHNLLPRRIEPTIVKLAKECDSVLSAFFRGQLLVMLSLGLIYAVGLSLIGLKIGILVGLIAGLISIVPYLGAIVGIITASIAAFVQFGDFKSVLFVWLVFMIGQITESTLLTPNLVGDRIGLHPVAVIFAVLAGGSLFGFFGILLALPAAAVIMVGLRFLHQHYRKSKLYQ